MLRREACLLFAAVLLVGLMAGCGGGGSPGSPVGQTATATATLAPEAAAGDVSAMGALGIVTLHSVADTFLDQATPATNYGGAQTMYAGNDWGGARRRFSLVRFDLSQIPANVTVNRAVLRLYMLTNYANPSTYTVHQITKPWAEAGDTWAAHGSDFLATPAATSVIQPTMVGSYVDFNVTDLVRTWGAVRGSNYGCLIRRREAAELSGAQFATREYGGHDPLLVVYYAGAGPAPVPLGTAGNFVLLAKTGISTTGTTHIVGNLGVSPAARTYLTGFSDILDPSGVFSTSSKVTGKLYAANMKPPTPANLTTAIGDMQTAFTDAAGRKLPQFNELGAGNINGLTLRPALYKWGTGVSIPHVVTLFGGADAVWIFQIAGTLTVGNGAMVTLSGGAQPQNIFWQVSGKATLGTTSQFKGIILGKTAIVLKTGAVLYGRALAQTAVTLDANAVRP